MKLTGHYESIDPYYSSQDQVFIGIDEENCYSQKDELEDWLGEKNKIKRCRMCKHWGEINYFGGKPYDEIYYGINKCCKFFKHKTGKYYHAHSPSQLACENFEEKGKTL